MAGFQVSTEENAMEIMEPKEAWIRLHTQEVRGFESLRAHHFTRV